MENYPFELPHDRRIATARCFVVVLGSTQRESRSNGRRDDGSGETFYGSWKVPFCLNSGIEHIFSLLVRESFSNKNLVLVKLSNKKRNVSKNNQIQP